MGAQRLKNEVRCNSDALVFEIASVVADAVGSGPMEMDPPLGTVLDGDALQRLVESAPDGLRVSFCYQEQEVVVETGSDVTVRTSPTVE